jgi:hypothetical protein
MQNRLLPPLFVFCGSFLARATQTTSLALAVGLVPQSGGYRRIVFLITNALTRGYVPPPTLGGWRFAPNPARVQPVHPPRGFPLPRAGSALLPFAANCFPLQVHGTASVPAAPMARESSPTDSPPPLLLAKAAPRPSVSQGQAASPLKNCGLSLALTLQVPQFFKP